MDHKTVKDVMIPLDEYPMVSQDKTVFEAILSFDEASGKPERKGQPYRSVLILDDKKRVIGKIGQLALLRALEPHRNILSDVDKIVSAGINPQFIIATMEHFQFYDENFAELCLRARHINVRTVMQPVVESIAEDAPLGEAIRKIVTWNTLSMLVMRGDEAVGLLRISDLCQAIAEEMKRAMKKMDDEKLTNT